MLYEVITLAAGQLIEAEIVESRGYDLVARPLSGAVWANKFINTVRQNFKRKGKGSPRITSYNVCYTKLLRVKPSGDLLNQGTLAAAGMSDQ